MTCRWHDHDASCADHDRCAVYATRYTTRDDGVYVCRDCGSLAVECECWHECGRGDALRAESDRDWLNRVMADYDEHVMEIWRSR